MPFTAVDVANAIGAKLLGTTPYVPVPTESETHWGRYRTWNDPNSNNSTGEVTAAANTDAVAALVQ